MLPYCFFCVPLKDTVIAAFGAFGALFPPAHILRVRGYLLPSFAVNVLMLFFDVEMEKLCCCHHLPRIFHVFNFNTGSMVWITCVTITNAAKFILL